jgi:hypothetical protein
MRRRKEGRWKDEDWNRKREIGSAEKRRRERKEEKDN